MHTEYYESIGRYFYARTTSSAVLGESLFSFRIYHFIFGDLNSIQQRLELSR